MGTVQDQLNLIQKWIAPRRLCPVNWFFSYLLHSDTSILKFQWSWCRISSMSHNPEILQWSLGLVCCSGFSVVHWDVKGSCPILLFLIPAWGLIWIGLLSPCSVSLHCLFSPYGSPLLKSLHWLPIWYRTIFKFLPCLFPPCLHLCSHFLLHSCTPPSSVYCSAFLSPHYTFGTFSCCPVCLGHTPCPHTCQVPSIFSLRRFSSKNSPFLWIIAFPCLFLPLDYIKCHVLLCSYTMNKHSDPSEVASPASLELAVLL